jgi:hypothetical protein
MINVVPGIIFLDVLNYCVGSVGATTVDEVEVVAGVVFTVSDDDGVAIAIANGQEVDLEGHGDVP